MSFWESFLDGSSTSSSSSSSSSSREEERPEAGRCLLSSKSYSVPERISKKEKKWKEKKDPAGVAADMWRRRRPSSASLNSKRPESPSVNKVRSEAFDSEFQSRIHVYKTVHVYLSLLPSSSLLLPPPNSSSISIRFHLIRFLILMEWPSSVCCPIESPSIRTQHVKRQEGGWVWFEIPPPPFSTSSPSSHPPAPGFYRHYHRTGRINRYKWRNDGANGG